MEEEYDLEREIDNIKNSVDILKQVKQFQEVLFVIQQYTASTLPSKLDDDIRHSLNKVMSLRKLRNKELTRLTIEYMECISKLRTVYIHYIIPYLYDLTDTDDSTIKELAYSTFSNVYIYVLLAAAKVMRSPDRDVRDMWEMAEKMRKSLVRYYSRGGPLSLISLHFVHLLCHYFTKRDDRMLYNGKTGVVETSIQFTINDIPEGSPLFRTKDLVLDGYDYVNIIIQAFLTKASVFTFKHKIIAINSLFSIITHRKDFIPVVLPLLLKYKPSNETIQFIITSNMQRILKIPTFGDQEVVIVDYLTNAGVHEDAINRARDQRNRIGDFLKRKNIDLVPNKLSPSYSYEYPEGKDSLFDKEIESVMKHLEKDALEPLPTPTIDMKSIPLSVIKLFPISILASLAILNLQNEAHEREPTEAESSSIKREASDDESDGKRRKTEGTLRVSELLDVPTRYILMKELIQQLMAASQKKQIVSQSYAILFDTVFSLLTLLDESKILSMIERILIDDKSSSQVAEQVEEQHPFMEILVFMKAYIPSQPTFVILFLKRLYLRNKLYQQKCKKLGNTSSSFYDTIYNSIILYSIQYIYSQMDAGLYPADTCRVFILSLLQSIPVIPFEFFPFLLCGACQWKNQEQLNVCSLEILQELMTLRPIYCKECFVCMLSFASMLMKREGSGSISGSGSEYPGKLHTILVSALKNEQLFVQFLALATTQESSLQSTIQQFSSFTDGIVILSSDVDKHKAVQKSGIFSMTNTDASEGHMLRKKQEALLQDMTSMDFSFPLIAAVKCELAQIQTFIQYITTHQDSINSSVLQQLITQFCLPSLPTIHGCVDPISTEELEDGQYTLYHWKEDPKDYELLYSLVEILAECVTVNKNLVLQILRYCVRVSKITKDEDLLAFIEGMFDTTGDVQFKLLVMNWLEKEEVVDILTKEPIPPSLPSWLLFIAEDPYPLTLVELVMILCRHSLNKTMLDCLQTCIRSDLYPISIFTEALGYLLIENIDCQTLSYILLSIVTGKANVEAQVCNCLVDYTQRGGFKNLQKKAPLIQFIGRCKEASAALLYVMSREELEGIMKEIPDTKNWLLNYFEKEGKTIPDYMTSLLY